MFEEVLQVIVLLFFPFSGNCCGFICITLKFARTPIFQKVIVCLFGGKKKHLQAWRFSKACFFVKFLEKKSPGAWLLRPEERWEGYSSGPSDRGALPPCPVQLSLREAAQYLLSSGSLEALI